MLLYFIMVHKLKAYEPRHNKTNKMSVRPAKTQISLGIRPVWSESSLCAQWVAKDPWFLHADSDDSDRADLSLRWAHTHFVGFVMSRLILWKFMQLECYGFLLSQSTYKNKKPYLEEKRSGWVVFFSYNNWFESRQTLACHMRTTRRQSYQQLCYSLPE